MRQKRASIAGRKLLLHIPETPEEMGAGYTAVPLRDGEGMLFGFKRPRIIPVDMREMSDSLDAVFLNDGIVREIVFNLMPKSERYYYGVGDALLEVSRGSLPEVELNDELKFD